MNPLVLPGQAVGQIWRNQDRFDHRAREWQLVPRAKLVGMSLLDTAVGGDKQVLEDLLRLADEFELGV